VQCLDAPDWKAVGGGMSDQLYTGPRRYGRVKFSTIQATKNELRRAIQEEGTERIQTLWDRLEQWIDSPPMMEKQG